jgi:type III pantothenate kinase
VVLVSVVPDLQAALQAELPDLRVVDHRLVWPFSLDVTEPAAVGADRLANAAAAVAAGWRDAIVVDAGTATTFDVVRAGAFAGGLIAPGLALAARSLGEAAARLAPEPFAPAPLEVARDTAGAIRAGCYHTGRNGVLTTLARLRHQLGDPPVVFTGGLAEHLVGPDDLHDPSWTARGAAWLVEQLA